MVQEGDIEKKLEEMTKDSGLIVDSTNFEQELKKINSHIILKKDEYVINHDIIVGPTGIFEIKLGTELYFKEETGIISFGIMRGMGKKAGGIIFTAKDEHWKNITIVGHDADKTILEYCVISKGTGREIVELKKEGGFAYESKDKNGGGIQIISSNPTIRNCIIEHNSAHDGAGIYVDVYSDPEIKNNNIEHNKAGYSDTIIKIALAGGINSSKYKRNNHIKYNTPRNTSW